MARPNKTVTTTRAANVSRDSQLWWTADALRGNVCDPCDGSPGMFVQSVDCLLPFAHKGAWPETPR